MRSLLPSVGNSGSSLRRNRGVRFVGTSRIIRRPGILQSERQTMNLHSLASSYGQLFSSATVSETADGVLVVQSAPGRYVGWIVAFFIVASVSRWCWRRRIYKHFAPAVFFGSFAIPLLVVPSIATESVRVSADALSIRTGLWFAPVERHITLAGLEAIIETDAEVSQRHASRSDTVWEFRIRSGDPLRLVLSDLLDENRAVVAERLGKHGVEIREK